MFPSFVYIYPLSLSLSLSLSLFRQTALTPIVSSRRQRLPVLVPLTLPPAVLSLPSRATTASHASEPQKEAEAEAEAAERPQGHAR